MHSMSYKGNGTEKAEGIKRALETIYPQKKWVILIQETDDLPWLGRSRGWTRMIQDNLCGYDVMVFEKEDIITTDNGLFKFENFTHGKDCDGILMEGAVQKLISASVKGSYSLQNIEDRILELAGTYNLNSNLILTFRNGYAFMTNKACIYHIIVDNIHVVYSGYFTAQVTPLYYY